MEHHLAAREAPGTPEATASAPGATSLPHRVLALQRAAGNRATRRALAQHRGVARAPLDAVPAAQRTQLREVTDALATIDVTAIHSPPGATGTRVSGSVSPAPVYGAGIDAALHPVLMRRELLLSRQPAVELRPPPRRRDHRRHRLHERALAHGPLVRRR